MFLLICSEKREIFSMIYCRKRDQGVTDPIQVDNSVLLSCIESNEIFGLVVKFFD